MLQLLSSNRRQRFTYAAQFASKAKKTIEKPEQRDIFQTWLTLWRDIMLSASGADLPLVNLEHADQILTIALPVLGWQTASNTYRRLGRHPRSAGSQRQPPAPH